PEPRGLGGVSCDRGAPVGRDAQLRQSALHHEATFPDAHQPDVGCDTAGESLHMWRVARRDQSEMLERAAQLGWGRIGHRAIGSGKEISITGTMPAMRMGAQADAN